MANRQTGTLQEIGASGRELTRLKWLTTIVPAAAVFFYETIRHELLGAPSTPVFGTLTVGVLALMLAYGFSELVFGIVERLQNQALARNREVAALTAMMEERERLSRELHDGLAQLVAYLLVRIDTVIGLVATDRRQEAVVELEQLRGVADDLYADVRDSITGLRTRVTDRGLVTALQEYLDHFEDRHDIAVNLRVDRLPGRLPPLTEFQLFRIVQEALANVRKHARAHRAWVELTYHEAGSVSLVIGDDGRGFDPAAVSASDRRSFGLATMRERAGSLGGTLQVESQPGRGTSVLVTVPLFEAELGSKHQIRPEACDGTIAASPR